MERFGITEYYHDSGDKKRPRMALKRAPQDFCVHEIRLDGIVCAVGEDYLDNSLRPVQGATVDALTTESLQNLGATNEEALQIISLLSADSGSITLSSVFDKQQRTAIHAFFKGHPRLVTDCPEPGRLRISRKSSSRQSAPYDHRNFQDPNLHSYLRFTLSKCMYDTMEAVSAVARAMGGRPVRDFSFSGTKDRRAVTHQQVVVRNANPSRLLGVNKAFKGDDRYIVVSGVERADGQLSLGDLCGNRFVITLYHLDTDTDTDTCRELTSTFVNYFGLQRFGTHQVSTDQIGEAMLRQDYKQACSLLIPHRFPDLRAAFDNHDYRLAWSLCPVFLHGERCLLEHLVERPGDWEGAMMRVPRETRMLYVHAWQSLVFNKMASARLGVSRAVVPGDLVLVGGDQVITVTPDTIGEYTMFDVVIPMPGHSVNCPEYPLLPADCTFTPKNTAMFDLPGCYRKLLARAEDLVCKQVDDGIVVEFTLPPSAYATMFLREHFDCVE